MAHIKILLVEDDEVDVMAFKRAIDRGGLPFELTVLSDADAVLSLPADNDFSCIFLDYLLPGSDGLTILKRLRNNGVRTPVVIVTSQGNEKIAVEMMKSGALDYITKEEITAERISVLVHTAGLLLRSEVEREEAEASLLESQQLLANIFNASAVAMLLIDGKGMVLRANKAFEELVSQSIQDILDRPFDELFDHRLSIADLLKNGANNFEFTIHKADKTCHLSVSCSSFKDKAGNDYIIVNFYDVTTKVEYERQVVWQNTRMEALLESTSSVIFSIDQNYRITGFNKAARKIFTTFYNVDIKEGMDIFKVPFDEDNRQMMIENFAKASEGKRVTVVHRINKLYFETTFNPIKTENKQYLGISVFSQDITQEKNNELSLIEAKKVAEELSKAKSQFLSNMSHEIRTPMNAIIGLTDLLMDSSLTPEQRENLNTLKFSADNLLVIINDILDLSKIESGKITFEEINLDCRQIIEKVAKTFQIQLKNNDVELETNIADNVPEQLLGDPYRLTQILNNLVGNAVKFTKNGKISVSAIPLETGNDRTLLEFTVADSGIGIHKDKLGSIFESFTQAYTDTTRKFGGTGLGLAITKQLVESQHGHITVKSAPGEGTSFIFTIPFKNGAVGWKNLNSNEVPETALHGLKVCVAEDNKANQLVIRQILSRWKINVILQNNGREIIDYLATETPDIVFMDLQMPELSGFDAIEIIRNPQSEVLNHSIPVLALTADVFPETREKIFDTGMNDYLLKPINVEELKEKLIRYAVLRKTTVN
ncbi:MAG TPA: response regulator [Bacteroidia bacterium]|nr:response regulator [Bacteroidia bacterium]